MALQIIFWVLIFSKPLFWFFFDENLFLGTIVWVSCLSAVTLVALVGRRGRIDASFRNSWAHFAYIAWCILCCYIPWSDATWSAPIYALLPLLVAPFISSGVGMVRSINSFCLGAIVGSLLLVAVTLVAGGSGALSSRFSGIAEIGPNTIAFAVAIGVISARYLFMSGSGAKRKVFRVIEMLALSSLLFTFSKTTIIAILIIFVLLNISLNSFRSIFKSLVILVGIIALAWVTIFFARDYLLSYSNGEYTADTLSGRTLLWQGILDDFSGAKLLLGNGYNTSEFVSKKIGKSIFGVDGFTQAHNAYIEAVVNTGIIGLLFMICLVMRFGGASFRYRALSRQFRGSISERIVTNIFFPIAVLVLIRSIVEGSIAQPGSTDTIVFFFMSWMLSALFGYLKREFEIGRQIT